MNKEIWEVIVRSKGYSGENPRLFHVIATNAGEAEKKGLAVANKRSKADGEKGMQWYCVSAKYLFYIDG